MFKFPEIINDEVIKAMDKNTCHDVVHMQAGSATDCEYCQGKMTDAECKAKADEIMTNEVKRRASMNKMYAFTAKDKIVSTIDLNGLQGDDAELPKEIKVLPVGKWNTTKYGEVEITNDDVTSMVKNFSLRKGIPIDTDHDGGAANGWVKKLVGKADDGLYAVIDWTTKGKELLTDKIYKYFSPEFSLNYIDPQTSKQHGPTFLAGTVTNRPLFKNLPALVANEDLTKDLTGDMISVSLLLSQNKTPMKLSELLAKKVEELTADEKAFVVEKASELTPAQRLQFNIATDEDKKTLEAGEKMKCAKCDDSFNKDEMDNHMKTAHPAKKVEANEKDVTIKASELADLKKMAEQGQEANQKLKVMTATEEVQNKYIFSENGKGHILPKAKETLVKLVLSFSEDQKKMFDEVMEAVNTNLKLGEQGNGNNDLTTGTEFEKLVDEKMKANEKMEYSEAVKIVASENPKAYEEYNNQLES